MKAIAVHHASTLGSFWNKAAKLKRLFLVNSDKVENDLAPPGIFFYYWILKKYSKIAVFKIDS